MKELSYRYLAKKILEESNEPMSVREITEQILKIKSVIGKTPDKSISSVLQGSKEFRRVRPGTYTINKEFREN